MYLISADDQILLIFFDIEEHIFGIIQERVQGQLL
jgi:hypothetical protein